MSKTFFTSDTHFFHTNIIKYSKRPFVVSPETPENPGLLSTAFMNEEMIRRWNEVVGPNDTVYHNGDVFFGRYENEDADKILNRLNGRLHLTYGNHDDEFVRTHPRWIMRDHMHEIRVKDRNGKKHNIVLCHYGMRVWHGSHKGVIHLYGHSHGTLPGNSQSLDVGVDCWDYRPVTLDEILTRMSTLPVREKEFEDDKYRGR